MKRFRIRNVVIAVILLLSTISTIVYARGNANPGVFPPKARVRGRRMENGLRSGGNTHSRFPGTRIPSLVPPATACAYKRVGNVGVVVVDPLSPEPIECEVPAGTILFLDILSAECSTLEEPPFYGGNEEELRACAEGFILADLEASIDSVAVQNLEQYIHLSPLFEFTLPENNILEVEAGSTGQSISNGAHLMLKPLKPGEHTVHFHASYPDLEFTVDTNYHITVTR